MSHTKNLQSVHGRAAYYNEKSIDQQDPGATAVMYIFRGIAKTFPLS
ncbi:DAK2 domain-containing protein [Pectinatus cerevisiiphilus]